MRDLAARLRMIVRQDREARVRAGRGLTFVAEDVVPDEDGRSADRMAAAFGGVVHRVDDSACARIDRAWQSHDWHGRRQLSDYRIEAESPLALFDARAAAIPDWARRVVFFDVETTGLSGGAGTLAFLAGCGWFEDGGFRIRQFLLGAAAGERALLDALGSVLAEASLIVTFNGRTFDVPLMETRWAFHRTASPTDGLPHFDMLPTARRLWGVVPRSRYDPVPAVSCSLTALERAVLGFHRLGDVPGMEIPARYFQFLRTGDTTLLERVLEHNAWDLISLAAVMAHALWLAREGPEACRHANEQIALGRLYERAGDGERAARAFDLATRAADAGHDLRRLALARLAALHRREARFDESAEAWHRVLALSAGGRASPDALDRRAAEALAIHLEHRARDLPSARRYAEALRTATSGRARAEADHRLGRLDRKLRRLEPEPGAVPLDWGGGPGGS